MGDEKVTENSDGTIIVRLDQPVKVAGEEYSRLKFGPFVARHLPLLEKVEEAGAMQSMLDLADALCEPSGAVYELRTYDDTQRAVEAATRQVGKYQGASRASAPSSPSSERGTDSEGKSSSTAR